MIVNLFRYFSLRYLLMHPFRTFLTFIGVALGISLFLSILLLNDATMRSLNENIESMTGKADLTVTSDGMGFEDTVLPKIKNLEGVKEAIPLIINFAYLNRASSPDKKGAMIFLGIDLLKDSSIREYNKNGEDIIPDPLAFLNQADSIIATRSWSEKNKLQLEDSLDLLTKDGVKSFTIRGLVDDIGPAKAYDGNMAIMDIDGARYNFGREGLYDRVDVVTSSQNNLEGVKGNLKKLLGPRFKVEDKKEQASSMQQLVKSIQDVQGLLGLISFLVGFLIIVNTVNTAISQRRKDIGSLRTFGAENSHIVLLFAGEFLFLALCSSLFGCWLGYLIAQGSAEQVASGLNSSLFINVSSMKILFTSKHLLAGLLLGILSSVAALIYPLYKALQIHPIEAIKPVILDFSLSKKPKILSYVGLAGLAAFIITVTAALLSSHVPLLQTKEMQPLFLLTGLAGMVMMGPYLVIFILSALHRLPLPFLFKFSLANLLKNPGRTASTSIHLTLGFSLVIIISAINISFKSTIITWAKHITSAPHFINVTSWGSLSGFQVQPLPESVKTKLLALPSLDKNLLDPIAGIRIVPISINGQRFMIKAYDYPGSSKLFQFIDPILGSQAELGEKLFNHEKDFILMSEPMLKLFHKSVGETLELETPVGLKVFTIGGMVRDFASPNGVLYMRRELYKRYWNDPLVTLYSIHHDPSMTSAEFLALVGPGLNEREHLQAELPSKIYQDIEKNLGDNMAMSDSTKWIALIIGTMGLLNSFLINLLQRFRELGCIRSIGMTSSQLLGMILTESVVLGVTGIIVAFVLTIPVAYIWVNWTLSYLLGWKVEFYFTWNDFLILFAIGLLVSVIAGVLPAMKAARLKLREALEYE